MGLKKYEIITVGRDKRVRALRSWAVGDRYVNIGDVGGIVYDEKTLSQDGLCWLFRGNFGFPGARIGGDSIVDVGEATLSLKGAPAVDILGSSVVVGPKIVFEVEQTSADAVVLGEADFEQGGFGYTNPIGTDWERWKVNSPDYIRTVKPIFAGGAPITLKLDVPGYKLNWFALDRDSNVIGTGGDIISGEGTTTVVRACHSFVFRLAKAPIAPIVPADATTAKITFTGTYETSLSIIDSRLEINPATSTGTTLFKVGGTHSFSSGAKYPETIIRNSKVSVNVPGATSRELRLMGQIIGSTAVLDATAGGVTLAGLYSNIKNLTALGVVTTRWDVAARSIIQATDCDNFAVSPTIFPGLADAQTANMPFIFQGCNVPNGIFYHHVQIANTYKNIDFAKAQADLGKSITGGRIFASAEVEGMYRLSTGVGGLIGSLVESHDRVAKLSFSNFATIYGTTIYKDAYISGKFDVAGTNVFGSKSPSHPLAQVLNVQPRAVQGNLTMVVGKRPALVPGSLARVVIDRPFRINTAKGITVSNIPAGIQAAFACVDGQGNFVVLSSWQEGTATVINLVQLDLPAAYVIFKKVDDTPITTEELAGVTVTVYNGCKIVNTGATAVNMKGNIRVEDNATLVNADITGTGYFGGNCVASGLIVNGCAFMKDNAFIVKTAGSDPVRNLRMTENTYAVLGDFALNGRIHLSDNAKFTPTGAGLSEGDLVMKDNAVISGAIIVGGMLTMKDNAKVSAGTLSAYGDITIRGGYVSMVNKTFMGKRVIDNENAPGYDNNVKTQYDF